jgi:alpha-mannosidase
MWVEADTNLPSGESLLRQILYGKAFFSREFGVEMRICWLPDVFGYNANLPQILRKTGLEYFMTIKLSWNEHNDFPHRSFNWVGIDGSTVLVHMAPEGDYNSGGTPLCVQRAVSRYPEQDKAGEALLVYGVGDGGGGPGEVHIELVARQGGLAGLPRVGFGKAADFFDRLAAKAGDLPSYRGELYLEKHQGTYTTQGRSKAANRRMEALLHEVEFLATRAWLGGAAYPAALLERVWKEVLLYQFHDILPGSSIGRVYAESLSRYAELEAELGAERERLLALEPAGRPALVNASPFPRVEYQSLGDTWHRARAEAYASAPFESVAQPFGLAFGEEENGGGWIENEALRAHFTRDGWLDSLVDKRNGAESSGGFLNRLVVYSDPWKFFNAWDIDWRYPRMRKLVLKARKTETFIDGPRVLRRTSYRHGRSLIVQEAILVAGRDILEFDTVCDWHEIFRMLRADFRPAVFSDRVTCDIQFGSFERSTRGDSPEERAQFEICAHKWVDLSEGGRGLSLINDCKYGHRVKEGLISLGLLRSPVFPDPKADRGNHRFRYALYPHEGAALESAVVERAWIFNAPALVAAAGIGELPFARCHATGIVVETVKKAEEGELVVLRLVERAGRARTTALELSFPWREAYEADMLERITGPADLSALAFTPFEVKTLLVRP